jgi:hypothetical protein
VRPTLKEAISGKVSSGTSRHKPVLDQHLQPAWRATIKARVKILALPENKGKETPFDPRC